MILSPLRWKSFTSQGLTDTINLKSSTAVHQKYGIEHSFLMLLDEPETEIKLLMSAPIYSCSIPTSNCFLMVVTFQAVHP